MGLSRAWTAWQKIKDISPDAESRYIRERETMMRVIQSIHREEDGCTTVSLLFKTKEQLLDPGDPSPPARQELTEEAEESIISNFDAAPLKKPVALEIQLPDAGDSGTREGIPGAIRHHFRFVLSEHEREMGIFFRERRVSLAFTVINVFIAILYISLLYENEAWMASLPGVVTGAIIVILNWATVWDTYEFFIFDGRQRQHRKNLLEKIIGAEIRVIPV
jgi:hypothetical protein